MHLKVCFLVTVTVFLCHACTGMYSNFVLFCLYFMHEINFYMLKVLKCILHCCFFRYFMDIVHCYCCVDYHSGEFNIVCCKDDHEEKGIYTYSSRTEKYAGRTTSSNQ